jgi:hypothetical protein
LPPSSGLPLVVVEGKTLRTGLDAMALVSGAIHHRARTYRMRFGFDEDAACALGHEHDLLLRMLMWRMRLHPGLQGDASHGQRMKLPGRAIEVDADVSEALVRQLCGRWIDDEARKMISLLSGGESSEDGQGCRGSTEECASVQHGRMLQECAAVSAERYVKHEEKRA